MVAMADDIALDVQDLHKDFGGIKAVDGCHLQIPKGKISGLIGPNGSGKTTTFNLLTGVIPPDSGKVIYNGEDIAGLSPTRSSAGGSPAPSRSPASTGK